MNNLRDIFCEENNNITWKLLKMLVQTEHTFCIEKFVKAAIRTYTRLGSQTISILSAAIDESMFTKKIRVKMSGIKGVIYYRKLMYNGVAPDPYKENGRFRGMWNNRM